MSGLSYDNGPPRRTVLDGVIVGVVPDFSLFPTDDAVPPTAYSVGWPLLKRAPPILIHVKLSGRDIPETGNAGMIIHYAERPTGSLRNGGETARLARKPERNAALIGARDVSSGKESGGRCRVTDPSPEFRCVCRHRSPLSERQPLKRRAVPASEC